MRKVAIAFFLCALFSNASAVIIDNGTFTTDTATGLDWLDLTATYGLTFNQVTTQLGPGGSLQGWRRASEGDLITFLTNYYGQGPDRVPPAEGWDNFPDEDLFGESAVQATLIQYLGDPSGNNPASNARYAQGYYDRASPTGHYIARIHDRDGGGEVADYTNMVLSFGLNDNSVVGDIGSYLVRDAPEPPFYAALFAAFGLIAYRRYGARA